MGSQGRISDGWFDYAHDTYLESAMGLGLPASLLLLLAVALPVVLCARALPARRRGALEPALAVAASVLVDTHALLDFSAQIPAVAITWAALLGIAMARLGDRWSRQAARRDRRLRLAAAGLTGACGLGLLVLAGPRAMAVVTARPAAAVEAQLLDGR